jgi:hypothetical protein
MDSLTCDEDMLGCILAYLPLADNLRCIQPCSRWHKAVGRGRITSLRINLTAHKSTDAPTSFTLREGKGRKSSDTHALALRLRALLASLKGLKRLEYAGRCGTLSQALTGLEPSHSVQELR